MSLLYDRSGSGYALNTVPLNSQRGAVLAKAITLAGNGFTAVAEVPYAGTYVWAYSFGGTSPSLVLESLGTDGITWQTVGTAPTASGSQTVVVAAQSSFRLRNGTANSITNLSSSIS